MKNKSLASPPPPVDLVTLRDHFKNTYKLREDQVELMIRSTQMSLKSCLERTKGLTEDADDIEFQKIGHTLKGLFLNMGLEEWAAWARELEVAAKSGRKISGPNIVEVLQMGFKAVRDHGNPS